MKLNKICFVLAMLCLIAPAAQRSLAVCAVGAANDDQSMAVRSFGTMYADPIEIVYGESFVIDCDAQLLSVEATILETIVQVDGRRPAQVGDAVLCTIYDAAHAVVMSEQVAIPTADVQNTLTFDFSTREFKLAAGLYYFMLSTPDDCWANVIMGTEYPDGDATLFMLGTWTAQSGDTMFNIQWDPASTLVADEDHPWGAVKALYR